MNAVYYLYSHYKTTLFFVSTIKIHIQNSPYPESTGGFWEADIGWRQGAGFWQKQTLARPGIP
ncbi:hypothetical protein EMIT0P43_40306 [Pseudomonas jessenii]